jgi:hypothetical protein
MGKQVGFLLTHADDLLFLDGISRYSDVAILRCSFSKSSEMILPALPPLSSRSIVGHGHLLLCSPSLKPKIVFKMRSLTGLYDADINKPLFEQFSELHVYRKIAERRNYGIDTSESGGCISAMYSSK